jgi:hypothetical protein
MNRKGKADTARVMGIRWVWDYQARKWVGNSLIGAWHLWQQDQKWLLVSPTGTIYTLDKRDRYAAMVQAGFKIAEIEADVAGR